MGTREGQRVLAHTRVAQDAGETVLEVTAAEERVDDAAPVAVGSLKALFLSLLDLLATLLHQPVER